MGKATISITETKEFIRVTGKMVKKKALANLSLMTNMDIQGNGNKIKRMAEAHIYTQMVKNMKDGG